VKYVIILSIAQLQKTNSTLYNCNRNPEIVTKPSATASASSESTTIPPDEGGYKEDKDRFWVNGILDKGTGKVISAAIGRISGQE
jgi:hypothetical protein